MEKLGPADLVIIFVRCAGLVESKIHGIFAQGLVVGAHIYHAWHDAVWVEPRCRHIQVQLPCVCRDRIFRTLECSCSGFHQYPQSSRPLTACSLRDTKGYDCDIKGPVLSSACCGMQSLESPHQEKPLLSSPDSPQGEKGKRGLLLIHKKALMYR